MYIYIYVYIYMHYTLQVDGQRGNYKRCNWILEKSSDAYNYQLGKKIVRKRKWLTKFMIYSDFAWISCDDVCQKNKFPLTRNKKEQCILFILFTRPEKLLCRIVKLFCLMVCANDEWMNFPLVFQLVGCVSPLYPIICQSFHF